MALTFSQLSLGEGRIRPGLASTNSFNRLMESLSHFHCVCAGPTDVGLDELKRKLLISDPQHFSVTIPRKFTSLVWTKRELISGGGSPVFTLSFDLSKFQNIKKIV